MDSKERLYRAVSVDMIGVENGTNRFTQDGVTTMPPVARWRNNLTAMSQHENLFFIASGDCIAVYQPEFPYQTLKRHPALLIKPELANPHAQGYMSQSRYRAEEHCINHLIVGDLGSQEIVLLATDSGNVEAYYTASIASAIVEVQRNGLTNRLADSVGLQPFFKHWVYQSAWGLDIHKAARMIAVSSNVPGPLQPYHHGDGTKATVTVFAFALTDSSSDSEEEPGEEGDSEYDGEDDDHEDDDDDEDMLDAEWTLWNTHRKAERPERTRNYKVVLKGKDGHINNIPNICFLNSSEDSNGIWLLSTDITGIMKLWQIWKGARIRQWDFSNDDSRVREFPGWHVATLDVSIFRPVRTNNEFIGADRAPIHYGYHDQGPSFNVTSIARQVPDNSRFHPSHSDFSDEESEGDQVINSDDIDEEDSMEGIDTTTPALSLPSLDIQISEDGTDSPIPESPNIPLEFEYVQEEYDSEHESDFDDSDEDEVDESTEGAPVMQPPGNRRVSEMRSKVKPYQLPDMPIPEIAMIHCSNTGIRMLGSPRARYPHVFCANVLHQTLPEHILHDQPGFELQNMNRLNMMHMIPELGILLIATQAGRVAVCSLTRKEDLLGFRLDWVLPTKRQERSGRRPDLCTLVGMAVAPVQGRSEASLDPIYDEDGSALFEDGIVDGVKTTFDPAMVILRHRPTSKERHAQRAGKSPDPRLERKPWQKAPREIPAWQAVEASIRYRIMLTYTDLSVLTYEISRNVERGYET